MTGKAQEMPPHWFATAIQEAAESRDLDTVLDAACMALRQSQVARHAISDALQEKPGVIGPGVAQRVRLAIGKLISEYPTE